jgi:hypothetical protein
MHRLHLAIATVVLVGCAPVAMTSPRALVTESSDFRVEAEPAAGKREPGVEGYIYNKRGLVATSVRLRVDSLDAAGAVVATTVQPLDRQIGISDRVYFEVPAAAAAPAYRVTVDYVWWRPGASGP